MHSPPETRAIVKKLAAQHPNADTELHFRNAYELLVATILSAQCTDERVNRVTPALFERYPDARALADAIPVQDSPLVQVAIIDLLAQLNDRDAAPVLRKAAEDARFNAAVRQRAAWALKQMEVAK